MTGKAPEHAVYPEVESVQESAENAVTLGLGRAYKKQYRARAPEHGLTACAPGSPACYATRTLIVMSRSKPQILWTRIAALAVALVAAVPLQGLARASYLCRMTGEVSEHCCCAKDEQAQPCGVKIEPQDCCELVKAQTQATVTRDTPHQVVSSLSASEIMFASLLAPRSCDALQVPFEPRPPGSSLFLLHCSLLI